MNFPTEDVSDEVKEAILLPKIEGGSYSNWGTRRNLGRYGPYLAKKRILEISLCQGEDAGSIKSTQP